MYLVVMVCSSVATPMKTNKCSPRIVVTWPPIGYPSCHVRKASLYLPKPKKWRRRKKNLPTGASPPHVKEEISPGSRISSVFLPASPKVSPLLFFCLHLETIGRGERPHKVQDFGLPTPTLRHFPPKSSISEPAACSKMRIESARQGRLARNVLTAQSKRRAAGRAAVINSGWGRGQKNKKVKKGLREGNQSIFFLR